MEKCRNAQLTHCNWRAFPSSVSVVKSHAAPPQAAQDRSHPSVLRVLAVSTATVPHAAAISVIRSVVGETAATKLILQCVVITVLF